MEKLNRDKRDGYVYDAAIKGLDANFWANITSAPTVSAGKLRFNAAKAASYILHEYGDVEFLLTVPAAPTSGDVRQFGLSGSSAKTFGAVYFDITGAVFSAKVYDNSGNSKSVTITWNASWTNVATLYRIIWDTDRVQFQVGIVTAGVVAYTIVATIAMPQDIGSVPYVALPILINNGNADNMDLTYVVVRNAAGIV